MNETNIRAFVIIIIVNISHNLFIKVMFSEYNKIGKIFYPESAKSSITFGNLPQKPGRTKGKNTSKSRFHFRTRNALASTNIMHWQCFLILTVLGVKIALPLIDDWMELNVAVGWKFCRNGFFTLWSRKLWRWITRIHHVLFFSLKAFYFLLHVVHKWH